ncbi:MAG: hypothetical protein IJ716_03865 [Lachnospiraceae bacterium]|nr:hypothetical protein [Lachnospiraceae bacterium]
MKKRPGGRKQGVRSKRTAHAKPAVVQKYKDTIFRMLYSDRRELLALYNAVSDGSYTDPEQLQVVTLEQAIYMSMKNDVSFILDTRLSLYEQQSTVCRNMPLRNLFYVAKQFEQLTAGQDIYACSLIRLPAPRFITFYNGMRKQPERLEQRLSEAYYRATDTAEDGCNGSAETPNLELRVLQLNINPGYNEALKQKCPTLLQYVQYVECVRKYEKTMPLRDAVEAAVEECIDAGILRDFLLREKAKVISMSIFEFDQELHDKTIQKESWEEGKAEGECFKLVAQVCRKLRKGKNTDAIAEELEEDISEISLICEEAEHFAPEYDVEQVLAKVMQRKNRRSAV